MSPELIGAVIGGSIGLATFALGHGFAWLQLKSNRAFDLRQSIYVEAAAALANGLGFFSKVAQLGVEDSELAQLTHPASVAMYKIHIVGTPPTIAALSDANHELTVSAFELTQQRTVLRLATVAASESDTAEAHERVQRLQLELFVDAMNASLRYQRHLVEVNICARRELGMTLDESKYRPANAEAEQRIAAAIKQGIHELREIAAISAGYQGKAKT